MADRPCFTPPPPPEVWVSRRNPEGVPTFGGSYPILRPQATMATVEGRTVAQATLRPPRPGRGVPRLKKRLWGSLRGSWPTPQNESKTSLLETLRVKNHLFFDSGDSFLTRFGGSGRTLGDSPRDSPGDSFLTF